MCDLLINSNGQVKNLTEILNYVKNDAMFKRFFSSIQVERWSESGINNPTSNLTFNLDSIPEIKDFLAIIKKLSDNEKEKLFTFLSSNTAKNFLFLFSSNYNI